MDEITRAYIKSSNHSALAITLATSFSSLDYFLNGHLFYWLINNLSGTSEMGMEVFNFSLCHYMTFTPFEPDS